MSDSTIVVLHHIEFLVNCLGWSLFAVFTTLAIMLIVFFGALRDR